LLQRLFLSNELAGAADADDCIRSRFDCFEIVLFPLVEDLAALDQSIDPAGCGETFVRACGLLTKVFLTFSIILQNDNRFGEIWFKILSHILKLTKISINIKNVIVVIQ
jgi:hypothetical protein